MMREWFKTISFKKYSDCVVRNSFLSGLTCMPRNEIIPYKPYLKQFARELRKKSTFGEVLLWQQIKKRRLGAQFHRQVPIHEYIVDFYCHELKLAIELDGSSHNHPHQVAKDSIRDYQLKQLGVSVIRIDDGDVKKNMDSVIRYLQHRVDTFRSD